MSVCQMHVWSSYFNMLYNPVNYVTVCEWFDVLQGKVKNYPHSCFSNLFTQM